MFRTSFRVIHQTGNFIVSKFETTNGALAFVIESLDANGFPSDMRVLRHTQASTFEAGWRATIASSVNTRPIAKPFAVDEWIKSTYF